MNYRVLFTRKLSSEARQLVLQNNIEAIEEEMIAIKLREADEIRPVLQQLSNNALAVFTSRNAVKAVADAGGIVSVRRIYAVAESTANAVKNDLNAEATYGSTNAADLASMIIAREPKTTVYFFCGNKRRDELPARLSDAGFEVTEIVVYDTVPLPKKLNVKFDAIAFFSPSAVQSYFEMNKLSQEVVCYSIGETTTRELEKYTTGKIHTSKESSEKCLLQLIITRANNNR